MLWLLSVEVVTEGCVGVYWAEKRRLGREDIVQSCRHKSMVPLGNKIAKSSHTGFV